MVTDVTDITSTIGPHNDVAQAAEYYCADAIRDRRCFAAIALIAMLSLSVILDKLLYPLTYYPGDWAKYAVETVILPILNDDPVERLIADGKVWPTTISDIAEWESAATKNSYSGRLANHRSEHLREVNSYVVLKKIRMPGGMYGARSGIFIVPKDIEKPRDFGSHNSYFFIKDGTASDPSDN